MSDERKDGGPAFPCDVADGRLFVGSDGVPREGTHLVPGMTLRDYFAAEVLNAMGGGYLYMEPKNAEEAASNRARTDYVAGSCYAYADAMLRAREK